MPAHLLLHKRELLEVALQEGHLLLLGLAVAVADDVVVLLLDLVELNFELDDLAHDREYPRRRINAERANIPSRSGSADHA